MTDAGGAARIRYGYSAFGEATRTDTAADPPANPFTYTGAYAEPATSAAGYYLPARNYDPTTGRLTGTDPAALPAGKPYVSAYAYADNSPTRFTDPTGRTPDDGKVPVAGADMPLTRAQMSERTGKPWVKMNGATPLVNQMLRWGPGARAIVGAWPKQGIGHYYNVINTDGKVIFLDFQNGKPRPFVDRYDEWYIMRTN